jgi:hypothetical protein
MAHVFRRMLLRVEHVREGTVTHKGPKSFPAMIDWKKQGWHKREETKKIWTKWWAERGEAALAFAHPPQK